MPVEDPVLRGSDMIGSSIDQICSWFSAEADQVSAQPLATAMASLIEEETSMKFHTSVAAGLKSGQFNQKKKLMNVESASGGSNIEHRMNESCQFKNDWSGLPSLNWL